MIGKQVGNYKFIDIIGAGTSGIVYRAYETTVDREVAIKVIKPNQAHHPRFVQRFEDEARLIANLEHPHIIPLYNFWRDEQGTFLVMRYIPGGSLRQLMRRGVLPVANAIRIFRQIADALGVAHKMGVIHRDLKPENILLDLRGNAYLTDFGFAKDLSLFTGQTDPNIIFGTFHYMSPEQLLGKIISPRSDIYALGIMLYEVLTGEYPYGDVPLATLVKKHLNEPLPDIKVIRPELADIVSEVIDHATKKAPVDRPNTQDILDALTSIASAVTPHPYLQHHAPTIEVPLSLAERNRNAMIQAVWKFWVEDILINSLHGAIMIDLGMKPEFDVVDHPWNTHLYTPSDDEHLPIGTQISTVFDRLNGKLLILGAPGSGKTTTLLFLARDLLRRAQVDKQHPIPVVFNLASWDDEQLPLQEWLVEELSIKYQVPRSVGSTWVESDTLLLLLDGLDEVDIKQREACIDAINAYRVEHGFVDIVVCSRSLDYQTLSHKLKLNGAIVMLPLGDRQIMNYLARLGKGMERLRQLIANDVQLRELAQSPLMLSIMVMAFQGADEANLPAFETIEQQRSYIFDRYVERVFNHRSGAKQYTDDQTRHYLIWLARQMEARTSTLFHIEDLQPDWLAQPGQQTYFKWLPRIVAGLWAIWLSGVYYVLADGFGGSRIVIALVVPFVGASWGYLFAGLKWHKFIYHVIVGILYGMALGLVIYDRYGSFKAVLFGFTTGFNAIVVSYGFGIMMHSFGYSVDRVRTAEELRFSRKDIKPIIGLVGLAAGSVMVIVPRYVFSPASVPLSRFMASIVVSAVVFSISLLYYSGFTANTIESRQQPNQGIRRSLSNANRLASLIILQGALIGLFAKALIMPFFVGVSAGLLVGATTAPMVWVLFGGYSTLQHFVLRTILQRDGCIPQHYAHFLDYAASLILLRKVGGGYVFIHRCLMEHIAAQESPPEGRRQLLP